MTQAAKTKQDKPSNRPNTKPLFTTLDNSITHIYVDGSYTEHFNLQGFGFVAFGDRQRELIHSEYHSVFNSEHTNLNSTAAELLCVIKAILWAEKQGYKTINIHFDLDAIKSLAQPKVVSTGHRYRLMALYKEFIKDRYENRKPKYGGRLAPSIVHLHKIKAHSGVFGNTLADKLAGTAVIKAHKMSQKNPLKFKLFKLFSLIKFSFPVIKYKTKVKKVNTDVTTLPSTKANTKHYNIFHLEFFIAHDPNSLLYKLEHKIKRLSPKFHWILRQTYNFIQPEPDHNTSTII